MSNTASSDRLSAVSDTLAAIVLSISALLTSWASFQAALWDGEQAAAYTRAGATRVRASLLAAAACVLGLIRLAAADDVPVRLRPSRTLKAFTVRPQGFP